MLMSKTDRRSGLWEIKVPWGWRREEKEQGESSVMIGKVKMTEKEFVEKGEGGEREREKYVR